MTMTAPKNEPAFTASTTTAELENCSPPSPDVSSPNLVRDQIRRVAKLVEETKLPKFTYACAPSRAQRYGFNSTLKSGEPRRVIRRPSIFCRPDRLTLPLGWEQHIHPEGSPYFVCYHPDGNQIRRIVTEEWLYDPKIYTLVLDFIKQIEDAIYDQESILWPESDLFLELRRDQAESTESQDGHVYCGYYLVHNPGRRIYWPENATLKQITSKTLDSNWEDLSGYQSKLEVEYWTHWNHFPSLQTVSPDIYDYVVDTIKRVTTNIMSAPHDANTDLTYQELQKTLESIQMEKDCNMSSWHIGRFMMHLTQGRLRNGYGACGTRLDRTQSVVKVECEPHSMIVNIVSPFLFFIPHAQLERAEMLTTDQYIISHQWKSFLDEIQAEWIRTALLAAVILAANCAFLAIPMFHETTRVAHNFLEQVSSYVSLMTSLFGFILAFVFYRRHKTGRASLPGRLFAYIHESKEGDVDYKCFEHLLLLWSLPHALVAWSAIAFLLAFLSMCIYGTFTPTKVAIGLAMSVLGTSTFYYLAIFGGGGKLFQIWLGRILRPMSRPLHLSDQAVTFRQPDFATSTPHPSSIKFAHDK